MLNLALDKKYKIASDSRNYMLQKVGQVQEGENKGEITIVTIGYYSKLENALKSYKELLIKESDIETVNELISVLKRIDEKIESALGGDADESIEKMEKAN